MFEAMQDFKKGEIVQCHPYGYAFSESASIPENLKPREGMFALEGDQLIVRLVVSNDVRKGDLLTLEGGRLTSVH